MVRRAVPEINEERKFVQRCAKAKLPCPKGEQLGAGYPDRLVLLPDLRCVWFEFKKPGEAPKRSQPERIVELRAAGHHVHVVYSADSAWRLLVDYTTA